MPTVPVDDLTRRATALLRAVGAPEDVARTTAQLIVAADAAGHESHGVAQLPGYLTGVRAGRIEPAARPCPDVRDDLGAHDHRLASALRASPSR